MGDVEVRVNRVERYGKFSLLKQFVVPHTRHYESKQLCQAEGDPDDVWFWHGWPDGKEVGVMRIRDIEISIDPGNRAEVATIGKNWFDKKIIYSVIHHEKIPEIPEQPMEDRGLDNGQPDPA